MTLHTATLSHTQHLLQQAYLQFLEEKPHFTEDDWKTFLEDKGDYLLWKSAWEYRQLLEHTKTQENAPLLPSLLSLEVAQQKLAQGLERAVSDGGKWCFHVDCGTGKTHGAALSSIELWSKALFHLVTSHNLPRIAFIVPTNQLALELETKLRLLAPELLPSSAAERFEMELVQAPKRTQANCQQFELITHAHKIHHSAAQRLCKSCPHREQCPFLRETKRSRGQITIMTHELAFSHLHSRDFDLVFVDEGIFDALYPTVELDLAQLARLKEQASFHIDTLAWSHLTDLLASSQSYSSDVLSELLPPTSITYQDDAFVQQLLERTIKLPEPERLPMLDHAPSLDALKLLESAAQSHWKGCSIHQGKLFLTARRVLDWSRIKTLIYMDATTSPLHARAILGDDFDMVRLPVAFPEQVEVEQVHWSWSKHLVRHGHVRYDVNFQRLQALYQRYDSPSTAWCTHKSHRECKQLSEVFHQAEHQNRVFHYGNARGSNRYEDFDTIVIASRYLPQCVIQARAELLHALTGVCLDDCEDEAFEVMEIGEMVQAAHRIRPTRAQKPLKIVIVDDRPILFVNKVPTSNLEIDVMVMDELDHVRGGVCYQALLYRIIDEHGAFIPAVWEHGDKHLSGPGQGSLVNADDCLSKTHRLLSKSLQKLRSYLKNSHQNSWTHLAASMGLVCSELKTSQGGQSMVVLHRADTVPTAKLIETMVQPLKLYWFEWKYQQVRLDREKLELYQALASLPDEKNVQIKDLARLCGCHERTVYRKLKALGMSLEELIQEWTHHRDQRVWALIELEEELKVMHETHEKSVLPCMTIEKTAEKAFGRAPPG